MPWTLTKVRAAVLAAAHAVKRTCLLLSAMLLQLGCAPSDHRDPPQSVEPVQQAKSRDHDLLPLDFSNNPPITHGLAFSERPGSSTDERVFISMLRLNQEAFDAVQASLGFRNEERFGNADILEIAKLLASTENFLPSPFGAHVQTFTHFTVATVPGSIDGFTANIYLVKPPRRPWIVLQIAKAGVRARF
jgi:hypothetical protein